MIAAGAGELGDGRGAGLLGRHAQLRHDQLGHHLHRPRLPSQQLFLRGGDLGDNKGLTELQATRYKTFGKTKKYYLKVLSWDGQRLSLIVILSAL